MRRECRWDACTEVFEDDSLYIDHLKAHVDAAQPESQGSTETESTQERQQPGYIVTETTTVTQEVKVTHVEEQGNRAGDQESASYMPR